MLPDTAETSYLNMGNYGKLEDEKSTDEEAEGVQPCFFCAELIHLPTEIILPRHTFFASGLERSGKLCVLHSLNWLRRDNSIRHPVSDTIAVGKKRALTLITHIRRRGFHTRSQSSGYVSEL